MHMPYEELLTTGRQDDLDEGSAYYAYGFEDKIVNGTRCFGHGGGAPGMNGDLQICPGSGYVVAVLANMDPPAARRISDFITSRMPGRSTDVLPGARSRRPSVGR